MNCIQNFQLTIIALVFTVLTPNFLAGQTSESKPSKSIVSTFTYGLGASKSNFDFTFSTTESNLTTVSIDYGAENLLGSAYLKKGEKTYQKYGLLGISTGKTRSSTLNLMPQFNVSEIRQGGAENHFRITGIYEIGKYLYESNSKNFRMNTGLTLYPGYQNYSFESVIASQFSYRHQVFNLGVGLNAGLECSLSDRLGVQVSIPVNVLDVYYSKFHYENPFIIEQDRTPNEIGTVLKFGDVGFAFGLLFSI